MPRLAMIPCLLCVCYDWPLRCAVCVLSLSNPRVYQSGKCWKKHFITGFIVTVRIGQILLSIIFSKWSINRYSFQSNVVQQTSSLGILTENFCFYPSSAEWKCKLVAQPVDTLSESNRISSDWFSLLMFIICVIWMICARECVGDSFQALWTLLNKSCVAILRDHFMGPFR